MGVILDLGLEATAARGAVPGDRGVSGPRFSLWTDPVDGRRLLGADGFLSAEGPISADDRLLSLPRSNDGSLPA